MIAKIGHGTNLMGALLYNFQKVDATKGSVLCSQNILQAPDGSYSTALTNRSFEAYLIANRNTEKPSLHISLNPDPKDQIEDGRYIQLAADYMEEMGYGQQPYIVFKHTDIERSHIHIVSTNVDAMGKKISDAFEHKRSMAVCRSLENKYGLVTPEMERDQSNEIAFRPVDFTKPDVKSQIAAVVRYLPNAYHCQSLGSYNALLSLFNITVQEVSGELNGKPRQGLVYFALDSDGKKAGHPFKASLFGKAAGLAALAVRFENSKAALGSQSQKAALRDIIEIAVHSSKFENDFRAQLVGQGINVVARRNTEGRIYGMTFIDHTSRSVYNGSQLSKGLAANVFEQWWNQGLKPAVQIRVAGLRQASDGNEQLRPDPAPETGVSLDLQDIPLTDMFNILIPHGQPEDFEETQFAQRMKKKRRKNK